jgi:lipoate-protein ligase A
MQLLISQSTEPEINLATEEFLLKHSGENIVFLYRNKKCVVVGKHQNAMAEINYRFVKENNIPVIRRISGGGTVYHDEGNLNFTFLQNGEEGNLVNFKAFISPVAAFLKELGAPAVIGPRNDILLDGLKVSGNAEHIYRKRTLHHGTLLFSSTLTDLRNALHTESGKYTDKAVKSVRSKVTNIKENIAGDWTTDQFFHRFADFL